MDQETAKRLIREYLGSIKRKGASELCVAIERHAGFLIPRRTVEEWLRQRGRTLNSTYFTAVLKFIGSAEFIQVVPRARDYVDGEGWLKRAGDVLFGIYGTPDADPLEIADALAQVEGLWMEEGTGPTVIAVRRVEGHLFSRFHLIWAGYIVYSGVVLWRRDIAFIAKLWSRRMPEELSVSVWCASGEPEQTDAFKKFMSQPDPSKRYMRVNFSHIISAQHPLHRTSPPYHCYFYPREAPADQDLIELIDRLDMNVIPYGIGQAKN